MTDDRRETPAERVIGRAAEGASQTGDRSPAGLARPSARSRPTSRPASARGGWSACRRSTAASWPRSSASGRAYRALQEECRGDARAAFARRWRAAARAWAFDELNELIAQHNDWYPIERQLPMDPRTRDYVSLRRQVVSPAHLGPEWVLGAVPGAAAGEPLSAAAERR